MSESGHERGDGFRILMLVDFLPDQSHPDPWLQNRNIFVYRQALKVSERHPMDCPVLVPRLGALVRGLYGLAGRELKFPRPRSGSDRGISYHSIRYFHLPRYYTQRKTHALLRSNLLKHTEFDLIHCHTVYDLGLVGLELKQRLGIPLVQTVYGTDVNWLFEDSSRRASPEIDSATRKVLRGADAVIGVSRDLCDKVRQLGVDKQKIHWAPNGVDRELFGPGSKDAEREKLGWASEEKIILYVGNILQTKGLGELVEAVRILNERGRADNLSLKIAGPDGGYKAEMVGKIEQAGLKGKFEFLGKIEHERIAALMRAADLFCLPSWREGWPNVVVESLACGTPVVATTVGGIVEIVRTDEQGILAPPREPGALADALELALERDWDRGKVREAAEGYYYDGIAETIEGVYRGVVEPES